MLTLQIIISFIAGGIFICMQTLLAERVPVRWRGLVLTVPTTMALGFFFIGLTKSVYDIPEVATFFPAALMPDYIFVAAFAFLAQYSLALSFVVSYALWALFAYIIVSYPPETFLSSTFLYSLPIIVILYFLIKKLPQVTALVPVPFNVKHVLIRSLIGGTIIASVVILSKTLGNIWGSLFSAFPAAFSATLMIYYVVHGKQIIPSVAKSMFFPGVIGYILYAGVAILAFPRFGIWYGTLACYAVVIPFCYAYSVVMKTIKDRTLRAPVAANAKLD